MQATFGPLTVKLKYVYERDAVLYYQRWIPEDLRERCRKSKIKERLQATSITAAAREVSRLNAKYERAWQMLRESPEATPETVLIDAEALLRDWGLSPGAGAKGKPDSEPVDLFRDYLDGKAERYPEPEPEAGYTIAAEREPLSVVESVAARLLAGEEFQALPDADDRATLSDVLEHYLAASAKTDNSKFVADTRRVFAVLIDIVGDKPFAEFSRADGRAYVAAEVERVSTGTVRRRLNTLHAAFEEYIREHSPDLRNPVDGLKIQGYGNDVKKRPSLSQSDLQRLADACREVDDSLRWLVALMIHTGARIAEIAGLTMADIVLDASPPRVVIRWHEGRTIKGAKTAREVPLVGHALWAARRIVASATPGQVYAFPQYMKPGRDPHKAGNAPSQAVNKWMRSRGLNYTSHSLRHTLNGLLRDAECPREVRELIEGHASKHTNDRYGPRMALDVIHNWLLKVVPSEMG